MIAKYPTQMAANATAGPVPAGCPLTLSGRSDTIVPT
jgi:hypothetical protein